MELQLHDLPWRLDYMTYDLTLVRRNLCVPVVILSALGSNGNTIS